jgi:hypothetical protein
MENSTGNATAEGMPFTSANDGFFAIFNDLSLVNTFPSGCTYLSHEMNPNSNNVQLSALGAANRTGLTDSNFTNTTEIQFSGFYWLA